MTTEDWRNIREGALERDGYQCVECGAEETLEVHHIEPTDEGGTDDLENLKTLCRTCHLEEHGSTTGPDSLGETDRSILVQLDEGRHTPGSLAETLDKHPQYIRKRLKWLRTWGYVQYHHEPTGLQELADRNE